MTPEICLISVPHNGTKFTCDVFRRHGWSEYTLVGRPTSKPAFYVGHCVKLSQTLHAITLSDKMPLVVPLRHPYRVEESWARRDYDAGDLVHAYRNMLELLDPVVDVWLPIDAKPIIRAVQHKTLEAVAGKTLDINWDNRVEALSEYDTPINDLDPSPAIREIRRYPLFRKFYDEVD
jgi:hypothetical protein